MAKKRLAKKRASKPKKPDVDNSSSDSYELPSHEELAQLPRRALVAYAVRCARRVQPLMLTLGNANLPQIVERTLYLVTRYAQGQSAGVNDIRDAKEFLETAINSQLNSESNAAAAAKMEAGLAAARTMIFTATAAYGQEDAVDAAASTAASAAEAVYQADAAASGFGSGSGKGDQSFGRIARRDFQILVSRNYGNPRTLGRPVNAESARIFGSGYWHDEPPSWYNDRNLEFDSPVAVANRTQDVLPRTEAPKLKELKKLQESRERDKSQIATLQGRLADELRKFDEAKRLLERTTKEKARVEEQVKFRNTEVRGLERELDALSNDLNESRKLLHERDQRIRDIEEERDQEKRKADLAETLTWSEHFQESFAMSRGARLFLIAGVVMLLAMLAAMAAISETRARQQLSQIVQVRLDETLPDDTDSTAKSLAKLKEDIRVLTVGGAVSDDEALVGIRSRLSRVGDASGTAKQDFEPVAWYYRYLFVSYYGSDFLLSISVMLAGSIGSIVAKMRDDRHVQLRDLLLGLAAGFIIFLVIRGAKNVFLINSEGTSYLLNPYSIALMGLVAGIYTDRAFRLLMASVDKVIEKLVGAFELNPDYFKNFGFTLPAEKQRQQEESIQNAVHTAMAEIRKDTSEKASDSSSDPPSLPPA